MDEIETGEPSENRCSWRVARTDRPGVDLARRCNKSQAILFSQAHPNGAPAMNPKARQNDILLHDVDGEVVLFDKVRKEAHRLDETVSAVWNLLDGERSVSEIAGELQLDESVVSLSVDELANAHMLEMGDALSVSRRAALKKVAAVAAIGLALPAVASVPAPAAAQSQSGGRGGRPGRGGRGPGRGGPGRGGPGRGGPGRGGRGGAGS